MVTVAKKTKVVDCDTHFWQPLDRWAAYPHPGTTYRMMETFRNAYPQLPERVKRKLLGGNAERIFGL